MKPANLFSIVGAINTLNEEILEKYLRNFKIQIKKSELPDLQNFVNHFKESFNNYDINILGNFYIGYKIEQISKEFDLLRIGEDDIINIELKRKHTGTKIQKQLVQNKYYLSSLGKKIESFTYVVDDRMLLYLNDNSEVEEVNFEFLEKTLKIQRLKNMNNIKISTLFNPSNYLVSPFNSTTAFVNDNYFLTDQQTEFKKNIFDLFNKEKECFISISGSAGTGKTLLTYDIAKEAMSNNKRVIVYHCGILNQGQITLVIDYGWTIKPVKELGKHNFENFDLVIIDECQRIKKDQLAFVIHAVETAQIKCIFAHDGNQFLHYSEFINDIPSIIAGQLNTSNSFLLSEKIRTNKELAAFTKNLFDLSKINSIQKYENIDIKYFAYSSEATDYITMLKENSWKVIHYSSPLFGDDPYRSYQLGYEESAHQVLGQEYDNVVVVIDEDFYYNKGILRSKHYKPYYRADKMLLQMITRARNKLTVIIIRNEELLSQCLKIINAD